MKKLLQDQAKYFFCFIQINLCIEGSYSSELARFDSKNKYYRSNEKQYIKIKRHNPKEKNISSIISAVTAKQLIYVTTIIKNKPTTTEAVSTRTKHVIKTSITKTDE